MGSYLSGSYGQLFSRLSPPQREHVTGLRRPVTQRKGAGFLSVVLGPFRSGVPGQVRRVPDRALTSVASTRSSVASGSHGPSQRGALDALVRVHEATLRDCSTTPGVPAQRSHNAPAPISGWGRRTH